MCGNMAGPCVVEAVDGGDVEIVGTRLKPRGFGGGWGWWVCVFQLPSHSRTKAAYPKSAKRR